MYVRRYWGNPQNITCISKQCCFSLGPSAVALLPSGHQVKRWKYVCNVVMVLVENGPKRSSSRMFSCCRFVLAVSKKTTSAY